MGLFRSSSDDESNADKQAEKLAKQNKAAKKQKKQKAKKKQKKKGGGDGEGRGVPDLGRFHRDLIAPTGITERANWAKVGNHYTKTFFINGWPDEPQNGFLEEVYLGTSVQNDVSIHISPYEPDQAIAQLEDAVRKARARLGATGGGMISSIASESDYKETKEVYDALRETDANLFDVGMYITVRTEEKEELERATEEIARTLKTAPALTKPAPASQRQLDAMQAVSPINKDTLDYKTEMLGGAVGAMFPFTSTTIVEEGGVDFGMHAANRSPVIVDRFARDNGYNQFTVGKIGSGKSFSTKLNMLRTYASRDDTIIFMLDPLGGFHNVADALQARKVTVGGKTGINPMELKETPEDVLERAQGIDPYAMKKKNLMDFFDMYFHTRGEEIEEARGILEQAIEQAYANAGITRDISTHSRDSPTISDVIDILEQMTDNPEAFARAEAETHKQDIREAASRLLISMSAFQEGGELENLAGESDLDLRGEDVVYFDLSQNEGSGDVGLMMQILFSEIYERAKSTDKNVMFAIDEAHYIMQDAKSLDFLEQAVRHSRHYDLSINFITQTIDEFFSHEKAEAIVQQCSLKLFHRVEKGLPDDVAETLDLTASEREFIRTAQPGDPEVGYSEALLGVGGYGYVPLRVVASELEEGILTYDPEEAGDPLGLDVLTDALNEAEFSAEDFEPPEDEDEEGGEEPAAEEGDASDAEVADPDAEDQPGSGDE